LLSFLCHFVPSTEFAKIRVWRALLGILEEGGQNYARFARVSFD
jgi:hypothetical protein